MPLGNMDSMTADQLNALRAGYQKVQGQMAKTGTVNGQTQAQNLAAVINQPGNTAINDPAKHAYLQSQLDQAAKDTAAQNPAVVQNNPVVKDASTTVAGGNSTIPSGGNASSGNASLINSMYDNNYASQLQKLQEARQIQQQGLNMQETGVNQNALKNLNNNDSMAAQQLKQLQEVQANNGVRGGDSITAAIGNQTAQQQGANSINQDKANQLNDIQQKRSLINNNASANDLALMQQLQATRSGQLIDNNNTQDQRALQLAQLMGKDANGNSTLGGQAQSLAQQQFGLQQQNQQFNQGQQGWQNKFNYGQATGTFGNGQTTLQKQQMDTAGQQFAQTMGLNYAQLSVQQQNILGQLAISQQNANTSSASQGNAATNSAQGRLMDIWKATGQAPAGITGVATGTPYAGQTAPKSDTFNLDDYKGYVNQNLYTPTDPNNPTGSKQLDKSAAERYILSQPITNDQKAQLYKFYGIPMN